MDLIGKRGGGAGGKANDSASRSTKGMRLQAVLWMLLLVLLPPQILLIHGEVGFLWGWKMGGARPADVNFPIRHAIS